MSQAKIRNADFAEAIINASLTNSSITIAGTSTALGASISQDTITGLASTGVVKRTGANTLSAASLVSGDIPNNAANTTGSAATLTTPRAINGVNFDGSAAITITAAAGTLTGTILNSTLVTSSLTSLGSQAQALNMNSHQVNNVTDPTSAQDAATKNYVDNATAGLTSKASSRMATTANLTGTYLSGVFTYTATGVDTVDGVTPALGDRILLKNQTSTFQNGIYTWTTLGSVGVAGVLTRSTDFNNSTNITEGSYTIIEEGTTNAGTLWVETGQGPFTVGTTAIVFTELQVGSQTVTVTGAITGSGAGSIATTLATPGTLTVSTTNSTATAHTHTITSSSAPGAAASLLATDSSGIIGSTGTRIVKGWFTDLTVTNAIAGSITGSAATLTTPRAINGTNFDGSAGITITAAAGTLTGTTLNSTVVTSSLTSVGIITTGTWTGTTIAIANGGTGQITANAALNAFLPSQTSNSGKFLTTDGTNSSWGSPSGSGTVTSVSVVSANGFGGTVATSTSTPAITLTTSVTGILKGNATAVSAASAGTDYTSPTGTEGLSNKRITRRVVTTTQAAAPAINTDNTDVSSITALAQAITSFTTNLTGTPVDGDLLVIRITDNGTARAITWGTSFEASTVALPTTTVISTMLMIGFMWNTATSKWRCIAVA